MNTITFYGADWCPDCLRAKDYLKKNHIEFEFIDVDIDKAATSKVESINNGKRIIPTILINDKPYTNPDNATLARVLGINDQGRVVLFGADWCPDCRRAKDYLQNNCIHFQFIDVDEHSWATEKVESINNGKRIIPTILIDDQPYTNPDNATLKSVLKIDDNKSVEVYDSIIIGAGAAGMTTAIYAQRDRFKTLILEKKNIGGNAYLTEKIENYPGFTTVAGPELMDKMAEQAQVYGAKIETGVNVDQIMQTDDCFIIETNMGKYHGLSIVLATGSTYRTLDVPGEKELIGAGVHFCATCDGAFYRDKEVLVFGGGNSALEESIFLAGFCKKVTIVHRGENFSATETYIEKLKDIDNIEVYLNKKATEFIADERGLFQKAVVQDNKSGRRKHLSADGAFIFIGMIPNTEFLRGIVDLDAKGYITTTGFGQTSEEGIFAAGDCRHGAIAQVAAATGEGVMASYGLRAYLKS